MDHQTSSEQRTGGECDGLCFDLSLAGDVEHVGPMVSEIMDRIRVVGCLGDHEFEVEVALLEALANAVKHGCGSDPCQEIGIRVWCNASDGLTVQVRDPGPGFDPEGLPNPVEGENLLGTSGRGVFLIHRLMDEVRYEDDGATLIMRKRPR